MLIRILRLNHIGLFRAGVAQVPALLKVTAFYGENGRGKSTLSAVLDSCSRGKPSIVQCRATIDESNPIPHAELVFDGGAGGNVQFIDGTWTTHRPDILVFDSQFVHDNVHTGLEITSANRRGLYEFALGDQAQVLQRLDELQVQAREALRDRGVREQTLRAVVGPFTIPDFVALTADPNIEDALRTARRRVTANHQLAQVLARQDLVPLKLPGDFSLSANISLLNRTIEDLEQESVARVREHLARHPERGIEEWVNSGRAFDANIECPFCGQDTQHNDLIAAYGEYFSEKFKLLAGAVARQLQQTMTHLGDPAIEGLRTTLAANESRQHAWADLESTAGIEFDFVATARDIRGLRQMLERLFDEKRMHLLSAVANDIADYDADLLLSLYTARIDAYNAEVQEVNRLFANRKAEVAAGDANALAREVERLEAVARRGNPRVIELAQAYIDANHEHLNATNERALLRTQHDAAMSQMLGRYQDKINLRLAEFGAGFRIWQFATSYAAGQAPRATFAISIRGESIEALEYDENAPSFPTVLSDGDRRTLALAFFLARLDLDSNLAQKIIVLDDPMASFDRNRKESTVRIIQELSGRCNQVIVLSHDAYFLRAISELMRDTATPFVAHKIGYGQNDDAVFSGCDLANECATSYMRHYALVSDYLSGVANINARNVAGALRILIEEFYKIRYPTNFTSTMTLGAFITAIKQAPTGSPVSRFAASIDGLDRFNVYASRFHHSNPNAQNEALNEYELRNYARGALSLIHDDGTSHSLI